ncbi:aminotransferase class I/II-fold pyridoxal phosphate-dependent enzyme [Duodenibacillus massiliensis]|uniref:aminotransferase class I/II-fold pyridoxal phosphate-dependent enzyme n=1 Tax=Duodenibacillus massiliensis TaxID=1852381 RepID=UPI003AF983C2
MAGLQTFFFVRFCAERQLRTIRCHTTFRYTIDFADLEKKLSDPAARVMLMCNPHNPGGRVWTPEELARAWGNLPDGTGSR